MTLPSPLPVMVTVKSPLGMLNGLRVLTALAFYYDRPRWLGSWLGGWRGGLLWRPCRRWLGGRA
jgi:hypothetical protein